MDWIQGLFGTAFLALIAVVYHNLKETRKEDLANLRQWQQERFDEISKKLTVIEREIGDHSAGLRGRVHRHHNAILTHRAALILVGEKTGIDLQPWLLGTRESHHEN